ncbi:MAG: haloacid dehalogenase type II [Gammaproteobacteria bacterium]
MDRREFLNLVAGSVAAAVSVPSARATAEPKIKAVAFDAFPIFDPRPIYFRAENLFPGSGDALSNAWRVRQFEYQWLRALAGHYVDFWQTTEDALIFAAKMLKLDLSPEKRQQLMQAWLELSVWPDVPRALEALKAAGLRLSFLSNATPQILEAGIKNSGLDGVFEYVLSTDTLKTYKPHPPAYQMAVDAFRLKREEIAFVAFAGWDVAGAIWFGYPTFWINRLNVPVEELGVTPDGVSASLSDLVNFLRT